jgi:pantoate--beta-alanine ligase
MKIFKNKINLIKEISKHKDIAFVPTMGSIHRGHLSLIKKAKKRSKNILVSIYVNPKQFNSKSDFQKYPRNINKDIILLKKIKIKYLYIPQYNDIYTFQSKISLYLDGFAKKLCGKFRPNHFKGVIEVINRFLEIIKPSTIYLGIKDFQQLILIQMHIKKNRLSTKVVACPTIRQKNGIALSSRNSMLSKKQINIAGKIYRYLKNNKKEILRGNLKNKKLEIINRINLIGANKVEYLECINLKTLNQAKKTKEKYNIFIAYYINKVRLIDNL